MVGTKENSTKKNLRRAEEKAKELFETVESRGLIVPGKSELQLNDELVAIARKDFGIETFWHKKIVRAGANTLQPYGGNPPDLLIQEDDIVILDFGPVYHGFEADLGRTYVIGKDLAKLKIKKDIRLAWDIAANWYLEQKQLTGSEYFRYITQLAERFGYKSCGEIAGHIVGPYPHEQLGAGDLGLDIHPDNHQAMDLKDRRGNPRNWVLEIHFVDPVKNIGGFFEQLLP